MEVESSRSPGHASLAPETPHTRSRRFDEQTVLAAEVEHDAEAGSNTPVAGPPSPLMNDKNEESHVTMDEDAPVYIKEEAAFSPRTPYNGPSGFFAPSSSARPYRGAAEKKQLRSAQKPYAKHIQQRPSGSNVINLLFS